jgi:hypothetical protein
MRRPYLRWMVEGNPPTVLVHMPTLSRFQRGAAGGYGIHIWIYIYIWGREMEDILSVLHSILGQGWQLLEVTALPVRHFES